MDKVKCWLKGIESDQGYQNYLFYNGYFNVPELGSAVAFPQGIGVVNTIGMYDLSCSLSAQTI
jgi:hypothetical protein